MMSILSNFSGKVLNESNCVYNMSMIKNKKHFFLGVFIFLLPFLGLPTSWKMTFAALSGIMLVLFSVKLSIPKKLPKRVVRKRATPVFMESMPAAPISPVQNAVAGEPAKEEGKQSM